jgi:hypothetical protein
MPGGCPAGVSAWPTSIGCRLPAPHHAADEEITTGVFRVLDLDCGG